MKRFPFPFIRSVRISLGAILLALHLPLLNATLEVTGSDGLKLSENDWPWWRGPTRNGFTIKQSPPLQWSENQNIAWKAEIPGRGHGSPIVVGNRIFIATADESEQSQHVLCFDRETGKKLWSQKIHQGGWQGRIHARNTQASSTLASDGERVFAVFMHDSQIWLSALAFDGKILWQKKASDFESHWGYSTSPTIYNELIIVASDHKQGGNLTAFNRATGKKAWNTPRPATPNYASPVIYHLDGRDQLIIPGCDQFSSYDPNTGKEHWIASATTQETVGSAVADGNRVYASGGYPKNETVCVLADGSNKIVWKSPIRIYAPSMIAVGGFLYAVSDKGLAHCWDGSNGELKWREKVGGDFSASPALVNGNLYVSSEQGKTIVFKANPERFELIAENQLGNEIWSSPVICNDRIYLRVAHHENESRREFLYCIGR